MAKILIGRKLNFSTDSVTTEQGGSSTPWSVAEQNLLVPEQYDYISLGYTGELLTTATYKAGGAGGTTVATLKITYDGSSNLETITRI
jgi:hypothetical protein